MNTEQLRAYNLGRAFVLGKAFRAGLRYALEYALDDIRNIAHWVRTKKGHRVLIDEEGVMRSGRFKGQPIDSLKALWKKAKKNGKIPGHLEYGKTAALYKYEEHVPKRVREYFEDCHSTNKLTNKQQKARKLFENELDAVWSNETEDSKAKLSEFRLNPEGLTKLPKISESTCKELGIKSDKRMVLTLSSKFRVLDSHREISEDALRRGLALSFYGKGKREFASNNSGEKRVIFRVPLPSGRQLETAFDIKETEEYYEIMHFVNRRC